MRTAERNIAKAPKKNGSYGKSTEQDNILQTLLTPEN